MIRWNRIGIIIRVRKQALANGQTGRYQVGYYRKKRLILSSMGEINEIKKSLLGKIVIDENGMHCICIDVVLKSVEEEAKHLVKKCNKLEPFACLKIKSNYDEITTKIA